MAAVHVCGVPFMNPMGFPSLTLTSCQRTFSLLSDFLVIYKQCCSEHSYVFGILVGVFLFYFVLFLNYSSYSAFCIGFSVQCSGQTVTRPTGCCPRPAWHVPGPTHDVCSVTDCSPRCSVQAILSPPVCASLPFTWFTPALEPLPSGSRPLLSVSLLLCCLFIHIVLTDSECQGECEVLEGDT